MRLEDDIDFTTLNWVKQELDDTLRQARMALEAYVEDGSDPSQIRFCASFLHQVQGTLRMVELYGAAMVVEEMERLVQSLLDDEIRRPEDAYGVLMRGMVQMPDYLERLQGGHKDIPIVLLPLLNDLRACRGEKLLSESVLFAPDLASAMPTDASGATSPAADAEIRQQALRLRTRYQAGLLAWIKNEDSEPAVTGLIETLDELRSLSFEPEVRRLWWVAAGLLDAARQRAVDIGSAVKLLFGKVDREIKRVADEGESAFGANPPRQLVQNLLYYLANGAASGPRVEAIRDTYRLQDLLPTQAELDHAKGSLAGRNRALLDTVSVAIKEDLLRVKDTLDLYLRRGDAEPIELSGQSAILDRVADTLGMLGLGVPRRVVQEQRRVLDELAAGTLLPSEATLLDVAGALLYVEVSLDENIHTLGGVDPAADADGADNAPIAGVVGDATALPKAEIKRILDALLRESIANVQRAKSDVVAYIESGWSGEKLGSLPTALEEIVGAMRMLDQQETANLVRALSRFVEVELIVQGRVPTGVQVEHLADAFTSIEYYLEATGEVRAGREQILDVTRDSLAALGYWPPPSDDELRDRDALDAASDVDPGSAMPLDSPSPRGEPTQDDDEFVASDVDPGIAMPMDSPSPRGEPTHDDDEDTGGFESAGLPEIALDMDYPELTGAEPESGFESESVAQAATASGADALEDADSDIPARDPGDGGDWARMSDTVEFDVEVLGPARALSAGTEQIDPEYMVDSTETESLTDVALMPSDGYEESVRSLEDALGASDRGVTADEIAVEHATVSTSAAGDAGFEWIEIEEEVEEPIELDEAPGDTLPGGFDASAGEDIDDEIREVFIEEVNEEIANIGRLLPALARSFDDVETLRNVRRSFHTLKGSGRLVGALALGEFSWRVENMLNRVLDHSIPMDEQVLALLEHSRTALDQLRAELQGRGESTSLPRLVMRAADCLCAGESGVIETNRRVLRKRSVRVAVAAEPLSPETQSADLRPPEVQSPPTGDAAPDQEAMEQAAMERAERVAAGIAGELATEATGAEAAEATTPDEKMPAIEPMLLEVLRGEAGGYLTALESWIDEARGSGNRLAPSAGLLLSVHTLHGALGMVEVPVVAEVVGQLEGYLKRLVGAQRAPTADGLEAMADVSGVVGATLALLDRPGASVPPAGDLVQRLAALRDELPVPESPTMPIWIDEEDESAAAASALALLQAEADAVGPGVGDAGLPGDGTETTRARHDAGFDDTGLDDTGLEESALAEIALAEDTALAAELLGDVPVVEWDQPRTAFVEPVEVEHAEEAPGVGGLDDARPPSVDEGFGTAAPQSEAESLQQLSELLPEGGEGAVLEDAESAGGVEPGDVFPDAAQSGAERRRDKRLSARRDKRERRRAEAAAAQDSTPEGSADQPFTAEVSELEDSLTGTGTREPQPPVAIGDENPDALAVDEWLDVTSPRIPIAAATSIDVEGITLEWHDEIDPDRPLDLPDVDTDLLDIFVEESGEILDAVDPALRELHVDPGSASAIAALQRHLHTIKGNARAVGLMGIGDLGHSLETLVESRHGRSVSAVELVQRGFDRLHRMVGRARGAREAAYPAGLISAIEALAAGKSLAWRDPAAEIPAEGTADDPFMLDPRAAHDRLALEEVPAHRAEPAFESALESAAAQVDVDEMAAAAELDARSSEAGGEEPLVVDEPVPTTATDAEPTESEAAAAASTRKVVRLDDYRLPLQEAASEDSAAQRQSQELIRVRADLLDALVNYAGEVSIYRSRLEQQLGAFRANVGELNQTVERTREQLRNLELETETQIIARFQREAEDDAGPFDPLELDRFSTLQQLSRALAESVSDLVSLHHTLDDLARQQETLLLQQSRVASELQQGLMRTRMVPFETQVPFLRRLVRQSADELGKRAQLYVDGAQGEMDRNLLERMKAPLEHMLRNALAHGIETPAERTSIGKSGEGNVRIEVAREASEVLIRVSDDGRGLDREAIRHKAIERGLIHVDSPLSDRDLFGFITETGFSTADNISKLAGRGVGMDVVANEIRELGGSLSIDSEQGQGSRFTIRLPFTLAVTQAIMVRLGEAIFAVPMSSVQGVARLKLEDFEQRLSGADSRLLAYGGEEYVVHDLALLLGAEPNRIVDTAGQLPLLLVRSGDQRAAIRVDSVVGSREIVVKSTGTQIASVPGMFGATIMGDGSVVMILDLAPLVRRHLAQRAERDVADELAAMLPGGLERVADRAAGGIATGRAQAKRRPLVMVVDDSITMRKVTSRVLERQDIEVVTAKDGIDAVEKLQERVPDMAILDIEMPRMDGYELATYIRNDARLRHLPLMMVTSRTGEKHRQRAFEIGVDRFLGKPYQEADLLRVVQELIEESTDA